MHKRYGCRTCCITHLCISLPPLPSMSRGMPPRSRRPEDGTCPCVVTDVHGAIATATAATHTLTCDNDHAHPCMQRRPSPPLLLTAGGIRLAGLLSTFIEEFRQSSSRVCPTAKPTWLPTQRSQQRSQQDAARRCRSGRSGRSGRKAPNRAVHLWSHRRRCEPWPGVRTLCPGISTLAWSCHPHSVSFLRHRRRFLRPTSSMRPKSAWWIRDHDRAIFQEPIGTFREQAKPRVAPSFSFGTSSRGVGAGQSYIKETDGPQVGAAYDVVRADDRLQPKPPTVAMARPMVNKDQPNRARWEDPNVIKTEGTTVEPFPLSTGDVFFPESVCFKAASRKKYPGQAPHAHHTAAMGTGPRFTHKGGLGGGGHKSHFNAYAGDGAPLRNIRRWPEPVKSVRRAATADINGSASGASSFRLDFDRAGEASFAKGCGSDALYVLPSTFAQAAVTSRKPSSSMGMCCMHGGSTGGVQAVLQLGRPVPCP